MTVRRLQLTGRTQRWVLAIGAWLMLVGLDFSRHGPMPELARAAWPQTDGRTVGSPVASGQSANARVPGKWVLKANGHLPMPASTPSAHASNLLAMPEGHRCALMAFWFAGTRESAPDVQIAQSCFERATQQWLAARFVVNREVVGEQLGFGLRRLGNPVAWLDPQGRIHLFVVATGWGGWAAGRILHLRQSDDRNEANRLAFGAPKILPLSWLWNISFLVRGSPMTLADGGMMLPVYFEIGIKYPVALRFDARGDFKGMGVISRQSHSLQPNLLALTETRWLALMRDNRIDGKIAMAQTGNAGQTWQDLPQSHLINPDTSIAALAFAPNHYLLAHNSSARSRQVLDLSESGNAVDWVRVQTLARGDAGAEFSYPSLALADGSVWVAYTEERTRIAWQRFALEPQPNQK